MERMIKRIAIRKDGTISMSEFRKFAEKYQGKINELEEENKKLKHENRYRAGIVDILPKGKGHIAEETIQDLQKRIDELVWFEKEYHHSRDRIKKLEWILEHEYNRKVPY